MRTSQRAADIAAAKIRNSIDALTKTFHLGKAKNREMKRHAHRVEKLDAKNPDYKAVLGDKRESFKIVLAGIMFIGGLVVDIIVISTASDVIAAKLGLPWWLKLVVPVLLIALEVGIAFIQAVNDRDRIPTSFLARAAPYVVIGILVVFSLWGVIYTAQSYVPGVEELTFTVFLSGTIIVQLLLLLCAICLHCWLIANAELLCEAITALRYRLSRKRSINQVSAITTFIHDSFIPRFTKETGMLLYQIDSYRRDFPDRPVHFERLIPEAVHQAMIQVMGKPLKGERDHHNTPEP